MPRNTHVQLTWTDLSNITRCLGVTGAMFETHFKTKGSVFAEGGLTFPYHRDAPVLIRPVQVTLFPDIETLRSIDAWAPNSQLCFGILRNDDGQPSPFCPRSFLLKQIELLKKAELNVTLGFELEFFLLDSDFTPLESTVAWETKSFQGNRWALLTEIVDTLTDLGIPVWRYHSEAGVSQFEISIGPIPDLLKAADSLVMAREAIYHITDKHGKRASFAPKPFEGYANGAHMHMSVQHEGKNLLEENPSMGNSFVAGILKNLENLLLILAPTGNSYERLTPVCYPGVFLSVGTENKETALRLIKNQDGITTRFEVRPIDGTSNPYLAIGSLIAAGLHGIKEATILPPELEVSPTSLPTDQQPPLLPSTLSSAINIFEQSDFSRNVFGEELHKLIVAMRRKEMEYWDSTEESREDKIKLLMQRF